MQSSLKARVKTNWPPMARTTTTFKWKISKTHFLHQARSGHPQGTKLEVGTEPSQQDQDHLHHQAFWAGQLLNLSPKVHPPMIHPTSDPTTLLLNNLATLTLPSYRTATASTPKRLSHIIFMPPRLPRHPRKPAMVPMDRRLVI